MSEIWPSEPYELRQACFQELFEARPFPESADLNYQNQTPKRTYAQTITTRCHDFVCGATGRRCRPG